MPDDSLFHTNKQAPGHCAFPELIRMNYFHGQMLGPRDFLAEQAYHRAKHLLVNRCLHGWGVVCGLEVVVIPGEEPCPDPKAGRYREDAERIATLEAQIEKLEGAAKDEEALSRLETELESLRRKRDAQPGKRRYGGQPSRQAIGGKVRLRCGFAIDPTGHEIVVAHDVTIDLDKHVSDADREKIAGSSEALLYVSICYTECGFEPVRPSAIDACQITPGCQDARIRESYRIAVSLQPPETDERCEPCCDGNCDTCVLLATVRVCPGDPIDADDVDNSVRRPFGLYAPTVITSVNWRHGATYSPDDAEALLGTGSETGGLEIRFSRPIHAATVKPGVIELLSFAGGRGVAGEISHITGKFVGLPMTGMVDRIRYRDTTDERPRPGDRVLVIVRCDFLLDACCRAVDGNHVGGRVPYAGDDDYAGPSKQRTKDGAYLDPCAAMPGRGPWTSGNGVPGGSFESWFYIARDKEYTA